MIYQRTDGGLLAFRQTDHALLAGAYAAAWSWQLPQPEATHIAACRHDDGWARWELAPQVGDDGAPVDFIGIPIEEHVALYAEGIEMVEREDPFAGLVASLHGERLYTRPFEPGMDPRIDRLEGRDRELAEAYVAFEHERQAALAEAAIREQGGPLETGDLAADAEEAWRLLQVWDRLSLLVCMNPLGGGAERTLPPVRGPEGADVSISARTRREGVVELDPYPFAGEPTFEITAIELPAQRFPDGSALRRAWRAGRIRVVRFGCVPA